MTKGKKDNGLLIEWIPHQVREDEQEDDEQEDDEGEEDGLESENPL